MLTLKAIMWDHGYYRGLYNIYLTELINGKWVISKNLLTTLSLTETYIRAEEFEQIYKAPYLGKKGLTVTEDMYRERLKVVFGEKK